MGKAKRCRKIRMYNRKRKRSFAVLQLEINRVSDMCHEIQSAMYVWANKECNDSIAARANGEHHWLHVLEDGGKNA